MHEKLEKQYTNPIFRTILIVMVFFLGLLIRLYDLTDPPMDFHPARQYHSALLARGLYERWGGEYPAAEVPLIRAQEASEARIEPPLLEYLTAATFWALKTDALWIPRLYSILFWLAGGWALYLFAKKHLGYVGGVITAGFFLLVPYGVYASRSFQPDPLMVVLCIIAIWVMDQWLEKPAWKTAILTGLLMGAAILVKQVAVFFLPAAFIVLSWPAWGIKKWIRNPQVWVIGLLAVIPMAVYNLYGIFISGSLTGQYTGRFFPELWIDPGFYVRWSNMIQDTIGLPVFILGLLGLLLIPKSPPRSILIGYGAGVILYGFIFAHHISTHDYYQLPVFPVIAVGLGAVGVSLLEKVRRINPGWAGSLGFAMLTLVAVMLSLWETRSTLKRQNYQNEPELLARLSAEMGGPGTRTIGLMDDYGAALNYYGFILPVYWTADENGVLISYMSEIEIADLFVRRAAGKEYFILSDFKTMETQSLVLQYLNTHFKIFYEDERYRIYDLKNTPEQTGFLQTEIHHNENSFSGAFEPCS